MTIDRLITIVIGIGGILAMVDSALQRYNRATKSKFAAEREFGHLQKNQEQMKESMKLILEEVDRANEDMIRVRAQIETLIAIQKER